VVVSVAAAAAMTFPLEMTTVGCFKDEVFITLLKEHVMVRG
jgi:hypothetical protein